MSLYTISDLHLSFGVEKPMDIFHGWENHYERLRANWNRMITNEDTVVIPGDISWASSLLEAKKDFEFINSLPGQKIILKGNHDFWWTTANKINTFLLENDFNTIRILYNNYFSDSKIAICGSRGWLYDGTSKQDEKIILRECGRIKASVIPALEKGLEPILFLHYPPAYFDSVCEEIVGTIKELGINSIYYGHIHGSGFNNALSSFDGIKMRLVSCDCVDFSPVFVAESGHFI